MSMFGTTAGNAAARWARARQCETLEPCEVSWIQQIILHDCLPI